MTQTFKSQFPEFNSRNKITEILNQLLIEIDGVKVKVLTNEIAPEEASKILMDLDMILNKFLGIIGILNLMISEHQHINELEDWRSHATDKT